MNPLDADDTRRDGAPWLTIPAGSVMSVEHPCIVKNIDKGVDMLGGQSAISQAIEKEDKRSLALSFRPNDPACKTILSHPVATNNILMQITVPKRTGRKRKRGSQYPFVTDPTFQDAKKDAGYLLRSMNDNTETYSASVLNRISTSHIWRSMPDFVYSTKQAKLIQEVKDKILPQQYPLLKDFSLPLTHGLQDTEAFPPPIWSAQSIPQNYAYRPNPHMRTTVDESTGQRITTRLASAAVPPKIHTQLAQWDTPEYPRTPAADCPQLTGPQMVHVVAVLAPLFEQRPIWTRRALLNQMPNTISFNIVRFAIGYVAYALRSGPWRDAYVKLGVDPRTDPSYRKYQTLMLQLVPKDQREAREEDRENYKRVWTRSKNPTGHIFNGTEQVAADGKVWQLCDLTDPQLKSLVDIPDSKLRQECECRYYGWYPDGTSAKMRIMLKAKVDGLNEGNRIPDEDFADFLDLPEVIPYIGATNTSNNKAAAPEAYLSGENNKREIEWAALYRAFGRTQPGSTRLQQGVQVQSRPSRALTNYPPRKHVPPSSARRVDDTSDAQAAASQGTEPRSIEDETEQPTVTTPSRGEDPSTLGRQSLAVGPEENVAAISVNPTVPGQITVDENGDEVLPSIEDFMDDEDDELDIDIKMEDEEDGLELGEG